jgi:hypothetical protein
MSDWGNDTPVATTPSATGWGSDTPVASTYKPDPVVQPPVAFIKRFLEDTNPARKETSGLINAFKQTYGDQPIISWRPEDIKFLQDWGLVNSPDNSDPSIGSFFRSFTDPVLKAIPAIPDTILRGINGLAGAGSEYVGQVVGDIAGAGGASEAAVKKVHDTSAGMSWEAVQGWFLYEMSNGAGFGRVHTDPLQPGKEITTPVGTLPTESQFTDVATLLGDKKLEPNVKQVYNEQGITPAEILNDAKSNVTITQDLVTGRKIQAYQGPVTTPAEWVKNKFDFSWTPAEFKTQVKEAGLDHNEVIDYVTSQPEVAGRWSDALNNAAVEARVKELHPEVADLYASLEQKKLEASNAVEALKKAKEEAIFGEIDKKIEETQAKLASEGGQGKRYKVYQERLAGLKRSRADMELVNSHGEAVDVFNQNIQGARMEWLKYDEQQRNLVPTLGRARKQAQAELDAVGASDLPLKEQVVNAAQTQQASPSASQSPQVAPGQPLGAGGTPPTPPTGGATGGPIGAPGGGVTYAQGQANVLAKINIGGKDAKEATTWNKLYTRYVDMFNPVRRAVRDQLEKVGINYKSIKNTAADPYVWFRLTKGVFGKANSFLNYGTRNYHSYLVNGVSVKDIIKPVADDLDGLRAYTASRRTLELELRGITSGFNVADAQAVVRGGQAKFEPVHRELVNFQNRITEYLKDSGVISEAMYNQMLVDNQEYTPFYRYFGEDDTPIGRNIGRGLGAKNTIKQIKGSEADIIDPLESVIRNTYTYLAMADKNTAGLKLVDLMNHVNSNYLQVLPAQQAASMSDIAALMRRGRADDTIVVFRDGAPEIYKVSQNKDLVRAWQGLDAYTANSIVKFLSLPAKSLRAGATLTPDFMARNFIRDMSTAFVTAASHPIYTGRGLVEAFIKTNSYRDWQASGGSNAAMIGLDRAYIQSDLRGIVAHTNFLKGTWNAVNHPLESLRATSELFENATRLGAYIKHTGSTKNAMVEAAYTSREATLDFARMGTQMRAMNMLDSFLNANIQGTDRVIRAFKDDFAGTTLRVGAGITLPSVYLWMANHKDPRYINAHSYEKDLFWLVMTNNWQPTSLKDARQRGIPDYNLRQTKDGKWEEQKGFTFKIPKPFELGLLFGSLPERILDNMYNNDKGAMESWENDTFAAMVPQLLPQFIGAPVEALTNHSFFTGQPIIPEHLKGLLPEYQYTEYTSETAKLLGGLIGAIPGLSDAKVNPRSPLNGLVQQITSPMILENYVQSWSGGLGVQALKVADAGLKAFGVGADNIKPETPWEQNPFIKSFLIRYPQANPQSLTDFRAHNEKNNIIMDSIKSRVKARDMNEYDSLLKQYGVRVTLNKTQTAISNMYKIISDVYNSNGINPKTGKPIYTAQDKRQLIDGYYYSIDQMATQANKMLEKEDEFIEKYKSR